MVQAAGGLKGREHLPGFFTSQYKLTPPRFFYKSTQVNASQVFLQVNTSQVFYKLTQVNAYQVF